jgi:aminoglycoside phosphotransferase (APT) family kinase protein
MNLAEKSSRGSPGTRPRRVTKSTCSSWPGSCGSYTISPLALVDGFDCVIHDDLQPRNVVVRDRIPIGLIDWEQARPGRRVEDVAKLCWSFIEPTRNSDPVEIGERWRQIVDVYGLERADVLVSMMLSQMHACADDIEREMARGSARHQALAARGDHVSLQAIHAWTVANEPTLREIIGA